MSSFIITLLHHLIYFYRCFCLHGTSASRQRHEAFLEALNDEGQQQMAEAWLELRVAQQEAPEEPEDEATQQEAPEESDIEDEVNDQPQVTYKLV
jgi:hypothetical protein